MSTLTSWFLDAVPALIAMAALLAVAALALLAWRLRSTTAGDALRSTASDAAVLAALGLIALLTLGDESGAEHGRLNLLPFRDQLWALQGQVNASLAVATLVANVVLFVPLGAALAARFREPSVRSLALVAFGVSVAVEAAQGLLDIGRLADVTDVLANTAGATLGIAGWRAFTADQERVTGEPETDVH